MIKFILIILIIFIIGCSNDGQASKVRLPKENITLECQTADRRILIYITKGTRDIIITENNESYEISHRLFIQDKFYTINPDVLFFIGLSETWKINRTTLLFQIEKVYRKADNLNSTQYGKCDIVDKPRL